MKNKIKGLFALSTVAVLAACGAKSKWSASNYEDTKAISAAVLEHANEIGELTATTKISIETIEKVVEVINGETNKDEKKGVKYDIDMTKNLIHTAFTDIDGDEDDSYDSWLSYIPTMGIVRQTVQGELKEYAVLVDSDTVEGLAAAEEIEVSEAVSNIIIANMYGILSPAALTGWLMYYVDDDLATFLGLSGSEALTESYQIAGDKSALINLKVSYHYDDGDYDVDAVDAYTVEINDLLLTSCNNTYTEKGLYYVDAETKVPYTYNYDQYFSVKDSFSINVPSLNGFVLEAE